MKRKRNKAIEKTNPKRRKISRSERIKNSVLIQRGKLPLTFENLLFHKFQGCFMVVNFIITKYGEYGENYVGTLSYNGGNCRVVNEIINMKIRIGQPIKFIVDVRNEMVDLRFMLISLMETPRGYIETSGAEAIVRVRICNHYELSEE